jgi:hypothetical protein
MLNLDTIWTRRRRIAEERMNICKSCEHLENLRRCNKCGCFMDAKTMFMDSECPIEKWGPVTESMDS